MVVAQREITEIHLLLRSGQRCAEHRGRSSARRQLQSALVSYISACCICSKSAAKTLPKVESQLRWVGTPASVVTMPSHRHGPTMTEEKGDFPIVIVATKQSADRSALCAQRPNASPGIFVWRQRQPVYRI